jgi:FlaA1/EpsC-like NDP-sugar epimerase/UDP-N-acetylmuramyl pentapeptide phosphotransferase/UDP-N-acetylglucosamine-1-phosphate transferase
MPLLIGLGFSAFVLSYVILGGYALWARNRQIIDTPNERSSHEWPTPRGGGLVIVLASLTGAWLFWRTTHSTAPWGGLLLYTLGSLLVANISWLDDLRPLPNSIRFLAHCIAASAAIAGFGYWEQVNVPFLGPIGLGWAGLGLTFFWIVGLTNAYNFMDGIDGIAGIQAVIAGVAWGCMAFVVGDPVLAVTAVLVAGSCLGFLGHNWSPARIFMGDVGSAFLGYSFAVFPLMLTASKRPHAGGALLIGVLVVWPFVFDTAFTFLKRLFNGENVFQAHRSHLYQRLAQTGQGASSVSVLYAALALAGAALAEVWVPDSAAGNVNASVVVPALCVGLWLYVLAQEKNRRSSMQAMRTHAMRYRRPVIIVSQATLLAFTYYASFMLRLDLSLQDPYRSVFFATLPIVLLLKLLLFAYFRLFSGWWRYVGMSDLLDITKAALLGAPLMYAVVSLTHGLLWYPRSVFLIDPILTIFVIGGARFAVRAYNENARVHLAHTNTLIVGAGRAGSNIARELKENERLDFNAVGFVDDDPTKKGVRIQGIKVLGNSDELPRLIVEHEVGHIFIAIPSASGKEIQRIIDKCRECKVDFKTLPAIGDILNGSASIGKMRNVRVEDLLVREPLKLDLAKIRSKLQGKSILITGAGGSIGSELSRQIAEFNPDRLVLFERSETDLYNIHLELAEKYPSLRFIPVVGDILDVNRLRETFFDHRPNSVFHAAAYKHVPMMEMNCFQAVTNNIFGTYNVALITKQCGVGDFVLISSDKAVNPSNIMGVTKRVAELLILGLQHHATRFVSVRFGNVLGSRGSVVPLFENQIARRKPITITDAEAKRYFMTTTEAVQLVLQASTMGRGGEIFVLDMGEPVKIVDLARALIKLSGLEPEVEIPIVFTGLRPGEKLFEELKLDAEGINPTAHPKIRVLAGGEVSFDTIRVWLDGLAALVDSKNVHGLVNKLHEIVPEYTPSREILSLTEVDRYDKIVSYNRARAGLSQE